MKKKSKFESIIYFYPFLFACYPVFALWLTNIDQTRAFIIYRSLVFACSLTLFIYAITLIIFRSIKIAAPITSLTALLFLGYGHIYSLIAKYSISGILLGRHRFLLATCALVIILLSTILRRTHSNLRKVNLIIAIIGAFLVVIPISQVGMIYLTYASKNPESSTPTNDQPVIRQEGNKKLPDVYYIILDGYTRQDLLQKMHRIDVNPFFNDLKKNGFYVADCAQSNYSRTALSVASSLNMNYLDALGLVQGPDTKKIKYSDYVSAIGQSAVRKKFESMGYRTATFKGVYEWMNVTDSTYYFDVEQSTSFYNQQATLNFQYMFLWNSVMRILMEARIKSPEMFQKISPDLYSMVDPTDKLFTNRRAKQYAQNMYSLESLKKLPFMPGPKFVYAHLFITHQPYVFHANGSMRWEEFEEINAYNEQVLFLNSQLIGILRKIIDKSNPPPIIIIQGDHGFTNDTLRMKIINAYYFPGEGRTKLYPKITPVNTFRLVFNNYFNGDYPLLDDISNYSPGDFPYQFTQLPIECPSP